MFYMYTLIHHLYNPRTIIIIIQYHYCLPSIITIVMESSINRLQYFCVYDHIVSVAILAQVLLFARAVRDRMFGRWDALSSDDDVAAHPVVAPGPSSLVPVSSATKDLVLALKRPPSDDPLCELISRKAAVATTSGGLTDFSKLNVPGLGTDVMQVVGRACASNADPKTSPLWSLAEQFAGSDTHWSVPGRAVIAKILGKTSHTHVGDDLQKLAGTEHFAQRVWVESVLIHLLAAIERKETKLKAAWTNFSSDSTTLLIGKTTWSSGPRTTDVVDGALAYAPSADADTQEEVGPRTKIHQSDLSLAFLLEKPDGSETLLIIPLVVPLQITDCGKAEAAYAAWAESVGFNSLSAVLAKAEVVYDFMSLDRDSANLKAHRAWKLLHKAANCHRSMCYCHGSWTVSGGCFQSCEGVVSGIVSLGLCVRPGSYWKLMKETLVDLIYSSTDSVDSLPPLPGTVPEIEARRDAALDKLLPECTANKDQRHNLKCLIRSDIDSEWILLFKPGGARDADKREFSTRLAVELLPTRPGSLRRQRWLTTLRPVSQLGLLAAFFNLCERLLEHFYLRARGKKDRSMVPDGPRVEFHLSDDEGGRRAGALRCRRCRMEPQTGPVGIRRSSAPWDDFAEVARQRL